MLPALILAAKIIGAVVLIVAGIALRDFVEWRETQHLDETPTV